MPCLFECAGGTLIEIPFTTSTADKTYIGYPYPMRGGPDGLANVWKSEFDVLYRESEHGAALHDPKHPDLGDRPAGAAARRCRQFIERLRRHNDIQFARCGEIAGWCSKSS